MNSSKADEAPSTAPTLLLSSALGSRSTYVAAAIAILTMDTLGGPLLLTSVLAVVPVTLAAWYCTVRYAWALATLLPMGQALVAIASDESGAVNVVVANGLIRSAVLCLVVFLVSTARHTIALRKRVNALEGLLPICSFCKAIRDDAGDWIPVEAFIAEHTAARFTHSVCPKCSQEHYRYHPYPSAS